MKEDIITHVANIGSIDQSWPGESGEVVMVLRGLLVDDVMGGERLFVRDGRAGRLALYGGHCWKQPVGDGW